MLNYRFVTHNQNSYRIERELAQLLCRRDIFSLFYLNGDKV
jgi:hypothetical protein